jgi:hypothetical protein
LLFAKLPVSHVSLFSIRNETAGFVCFATCFAKFLTFERQKLTFLIAEPILYDNDPHPKGSVAEPHHVDAAPAPGENIDGASAPAPPALVLSYYIYTKPNLLKLVLRIRIRSNPDLYSRIRNRTSGLTNDPMLTFLVCVKSITTSEISLV